jgi:hypothetical protein
MCQMKTDKPVLLSGLLVLYLLCQHCCSQQYDTASDNLAAQFRAAWSTDFGMFTVLLILASLTAVADAVIDVEGDMLKQSKARLEAS